MKVNDGKQGGSVESQILPPDVPLVITKGEAQTIRAAWSKKRQHRLFEGIDGRAPRATMTKTRPRLTRGRELGVAVRSPDQGFDAYVAVDASGTFSDTKHQVGFLPMPQAGVMVSDYATLIVEILNDNARPEAGEVYGAMDMLWATLVGQIVYAYGK
jgi:hypothetical protein